MDAADISRLRANWSDKDASAFEHRTLAGGRAEALAAAAGHLEVRVGSLPALLDVGCGVGLFATHLSTVAIGLDYSISFLEVARTRLLPTRGSAFALPLRDSAVGAVACLFVVDDYDDDTKREILGELIRVTSIDGIVLVGAYAPDDERMGTRRHEVSTSGSPVFLQDAAFYEQALLDLGLHDVVIEHVRGEGLVGDRAGVMLRHFLLVSARRIIEQAP